MSVQKPEPGTEILTADRETELYRQEAGIACDCAGEECGTRQLLARVVADENILPEFEFDEDGAVRTKKNGVKVAMPGNALIHHNAAQCAVLQAYARRRGIEIDEIPGEDVVRLAVEFALVANHVIELNPDDPALLTFHLGRNLEANYQPEK